ncbi:SLC13 family permease [Bdellovibrio bacteriovorus]|uniref:SLC13 family permease n=1 Tax=Bdellovibrio bacteriovorus TaxID=959 RepID=UPI0021D197EE|nr:SLC13 family permease [Bdellovibrio bacteriovorus]UXR63412.1 SLC13 family permease [Bdellovibrio bacteriovorus]
MKKYTLTEEHRALLKPHADKWIANAMSTKAMDDHDREEMKKAIKGLYEAAKMTPPPENRIVFVPSPFVARFAGGFAAAIWWLRKNDGKGVDVRAATYDAVQKLEELMSETNPYVSLRNAYESIEVKIFVMIAGVIPLGLAMEKTGLAALFAKSLSVLMATWDPWAVMLAFFVAAGLLTQILSDSATTVLIAPIAVAFAKTAGVSPTAAVVCVTVGAVASFLTPIGHHGNLLILGPGNYRFIDFLKIGLPLTALIAIVTSFMSLRLWN